MSLRNGFWFRLAFACISFFFFLTVYSQYNTFNADSRELHVKLDQCKSDSESLFAQLEVMYEHKRRMEVLLSELRNSTNQEISDLRKRLASKDEESKSLKLSLLSCSKRKQREETVDNSDAGGKTNNAFELEKRKNEELHHQIEILEKKLQELKENDAKISDTVPTSKKVQETHYAGNVSVRFDRQHSVHDNLEFNRLAQEQAPRQLIPAKELVEKLRKKNEAKLQAKTLQDPLNEFDAANADEDEEIEQEHRESPDHNEVDYKEME